MADAETNDHHWCQLGYGRTADVEIMVDESFSAPARWSLQVDVGQFAFTCELASPERIHAWAAFFAETFRTGRFLDPRREDGRYEYMATKELELGRFGGVPISIRKDGKYDDRYFLCLGLEAGRVVYTPTLAQTEALIDALGQVVAEMAE